MYSSSNYVIYISQKLNDFKNRTHSLINFCLETLENWILAPNNTVCALYKNNEDPDPKRRPANFFSVIW